MPEGYEVLRHMSAQGRVVSRRPPLAADTLVQLGLAELDEPTDQHDQLLLEQARRHGHQGALLCLRCRVSGPIEQRLIDLYKKHGELHGITVADMAGDVLDDVGSPLPYPEGEACGPARPFTLEVIRTFEGGRSGLPTWANRKVAGHPPLKAYLLQEGVRLISDWALLGDSSPKRVREAVGACNGSLTPAAAVELHGRYLPRYRVAKLLHRQRTARQSGWEPSDEFLQAVAPEAPPEHTRDDLQEIAKALRVWNRQATAPLPPDMAETLQVRAADADADDELAELDLMALVEGVGSRYVREMLAGQEHGSLSAAIWRGWAEGLRQRQIAERCHTNQARVSRILNEQRRAEEIATAVLEELQQRHGRNPQAPAALQALFRCAEAQNRAVQRLLNHLLKQEQEGAESPMRRWVQQALVASPAGADP